MYAHRPPTAAAARASPEGCTSIRPSSERPRDRHASREQVGVIQRCSPHRRLFAEDRSVRCSHRSVLSMHRVWPDRDHLLEVRDHRPVVAAVAGLRHLLEARALIHHPRPVVHGHRQRERLGTLPRAPGPCTAGAPSRRSPCAGAAARPRSRARASSRRRSRSPAVLGERRYQAAPTGSPSISAITPPSPLRPHPWL